jgi:hypothetical protein
VAVSEPRYEMPDRDDGRARLSLHRPDTLGCFERVLSQVVRYVDFIDRN